MLDIVVGQICLVYQAPVCHITREDRGDTSFQSGCFFGPTRVLRCPGELGEHSFAYRRANAVGANQDIACGRCTILEMKLDGLSILGVSV